MNDEIRIPINNISTDDRNLAGLAHLSILLGWVSNGLGGIMTSLIIWLLQKDRNEFTARQAQQSLAFQVFTWGIATLIWIVGGFGTMFIALIPIIRGGPEEELAPILITLMVIVLGVIPLLFLVVTTVIGIIAAVRAFRGEEFCYPITGRFVERHSQNFR